MNKLFKTFFSIAFVLLTVMSISAQSAESRFPTDNKDKVDVPKNMKELLIKKRIEQEKKEHDELLKRGEEAVEISTQLEQAFAQNNQLSALDRERLDYLAGLVKKIRKEIGASDDDADDDPNTADAEAKEDKPSTMEAAFKVLQSTTVKLVDELKKTTRFTISAIAIQSSNSLLRIVRFIRTGK
jgi:hypothetical protein